MNPAELKALQAEIATAESTIRNQRMHAEQLVQEAAALEKTLAALKARLPKEKTAN